MRFATFMRYLINNIVQTMILKASEKVVHSEECHI